jgi:hypothetical protein
MKAASHCLAINGSGRSGGDEKRWSKPRPTRPTTGLGGRASQVPSGNCGCRDRPADPKSIPKSAQSSAILLGGRAEWVVKCPGAIQGPLS